MQHDFYELRSLKFKHKIFLDKSNVCHNINWLNKMYFMFMYSWNKVVVEACNIVIVVFNIDVSLCIVASFKW